MAPKLQLLESGKIPKLLEILKDLLPDSVVAYNWLLTVARWSEQSDQVKLILMCPKVLDGTMVGLIDGVAGSNKIFGTVYAQEGKMEGLKNAMMETQLIEWQRLKHLIGIWKRFVPFLADVLREKGIDFSENYRNLNVMSVEKAAILEKEMWPENVRVGELSEKHLEKMCNLWPLFDPDLQPIILKMLQLNPSVGVFATNERGGEDLVSMVVQAEYGGVGLLQTVPQYRRKGYAKIALVAMTRILGSQGIIPHAYILLDNENASALFKKCGYERTGIICTIYVKNN